jgi:hypothetical protein
MITINDLMDELEMQQKETLVSGDNKPLRQVIDDILEKDEEKKRKLGVDA